MDKAGRVVSQQASSGIDSHLLRHIQLSDCGLRTVLFFFDMQYGFRSLIDFRNNNTKKGEKCVPKLTICLILITYKSFFNSKINVDETCIQRVKCVAVYRMDHMFCVLSCTQLTENPNTSIGVVDSYGQAGFHSRQEFFSSSQRPEQYWGPRICVFKQYRRLFFLGGKSAGA